MEGSAYVGPHKSFTVRIKKMESDIKKRERGESFTGEETERQPIIQTAEQKRENAMQRMFRKGDEGQERTMEAVVRMKAIGERANELATEVNKNLADQIEQLDRMNQRTEDTRSTLKRAQKNITYFIKALECDKCMVGLLALILLALVAVIVLAIKRNSEG